MSDRVVAGELAMASERPQTAYELEVARLLASVVAANSVTVEFGTGNRPLPVTLGTRQYGGADVYVGVNRDTWQHLWLAGGIDGRGDGRFAVLSGPGVSGAPEQVPLPDGCADVVFMGNVFGEPDDDRLTMPKFRRKDGRYHGHTDMGTKLGTLREALRLLKPDTGRLVILENVTPFHPRVFDGVANGMSTLVRDAGFTVELAANVLDRAAKPVVAEFVAWNHHWARDSYIIVARRGDAVTASVTE